MNGEEQTIQIKSNSLLLLIFYIQYSLSLFSTHRKYSDSLKSDAEICEHEATRTENMISWEPESEIKSGDVNRSV